MRTTLTLDDDVSAAIEGLRRERDHTLKEEVNRLIRLGLLHDRGDEPPGSGERFRVKPFNTGKPLIDLDDVTHALEVAEGPERP
jgi:hypothetical protein